MVSEKIIKRSLQSGMIVLSAVGLQTLIRFATQVALARMLEPVHFGVLAFASLVAMFFNNFTNIHGDKYIIKEKEDAHQKLDNAFTLELLLSIIFIVFVVSIAPLLMKILGKPDLTIFVQFLSISFLYNPLGKPRSLLEKELSFFKAKFPWVLAQLVGGIVGVTLAYYNFGIWSLLWWRISTLGMEIVIIWLVAPYRPKLAFNKSIIQGVLGFGWPLLGSSVLVFVYSNIDYYFVGYLLGEEQLGYYWLAFQTSHYFLNIRDAINSVVLPAITKMDNETEINSTFNKLTAITALIYIYPTIIILFYGGELIEIVFGEKWIPATTAFQIFMVLTTLRAMTSYWDPILLYTGKTMIQLYMTIYRVVMVSIFVYYLSRAYGINGAATGVFIANITGIILMAIVIKKYVMKLNYKVFSIIFANILILLVTYIGVVALTDISAIYNMIIILSILSIITYYQIRKNLDRTVLSWILGKRIKSN